MDNSFHKNLSQYIDNHDNEQANRVVMEELGNILVKDRENFITLLKYADVDVKSVTSDKELIELFIDNIDKNHKLLIGAAFLTNQHNKQMGFDGEDKVSDEGVKATHQVMFSYFDSGNYGDELKSNASGDPVSAVATAVDSLVKLGGKAVDVKQKKKYFGSDLAAKKDDAKQQLIQSVLAQRQKQQEALAAQAKAKAKQNKIILIASLSLVGIGLILGGIYYIKHKK